MRIMKQLLRRLMSMLARGRSRDRDKAPAAGRPADQLSAEADAQAKGMADRIEAGPFRSI
jgi:hypothetical protein